MGSPVLPHRDPEELLARARQADPEALGRLLEHYHEYLILLARMQIDHRLQGQVDPSDVLQDTYLEAVRSFDGFRGASEAEFLEWIRRILASSLGKMIRRYYGTRRRDVRLEQQLERDLNDSSLAMGRVIRAPDTPASHEFMSREAAVVLSKALSMLPADQREAIILRHLEGLSTAEVARRMGRTTGSVRGLCARAIARLRNVLGSL